VLVLNKGPKITAVHCSKLSKTLETGENRCNCGFHNSPTDLDIIDNDVTTQLWLQLHLTLYLESKEKMF